MAYYRITESILDDVANAIREKNPNAPEQMTPEDFAEYIGGIDINKTLLSDVIQLTVTNLESEATSVGQYIFQNCANLISVSLPNATSIYNYAFENCSNLTTVSMPNVTFIGTNAFQNCSKLATVSMPNVTTIYNYAFQNCSKLTNINLANVTTLSSSAFQNCSNLKSANLPQLRYANSYVFSGCSNLEHISLPKIVSIQNYAFSSCNNLKTIILGETIPCTYASSLPSSLTTIYVPASSYDKYRNNSNWSSVVDKIAIADITVNIDGTQAYYGLPISWSDWCDSDANTLGLAIKGNNIQTADGKILKNPSNAYVLSTDWLTDGDYTLEE